MEKDLKQAYLDVVEKNHKRSTIFRRIILSLILISVVIVVIDPRLFIFLIMGLLVVVLFFGVIYSLATITERDAENAYKATLPVDPNAKPGLNIDNVVETYMNGLKSID